MALLLHHQGLLCRVEKNLNFFIEEPALLMQEDIEFLDLLNECENIKYLKKYNRMTNSKIYDNQNIVKVKIKESFDQNPFPKASLFTRLTKEKMNIFHHIGIYSYEVNTLKKFISFNQSKKELENKLEQLRALDNKININVAQARTSPIGVDTKEDYLAIKKIMEYK